MTSLEQIFNKCKDYNIFLNLDETFCYTPKRIKYNHKYIGCIYSKTDINEIAECISEEGSCMLTYVVESNQNKEIKITNIFVSLLIEYGFDPYIDENGYINIIITDRDVLGDDVDEEDDDDEDDEEDDNYDDIEDSEEDKESTEDSEVDVNEKVDEGDGKGVDEDDDEKTEDVEEGVDEGVDEGVEEDVDEGADENTEDDVENVEEDVEADDVEENIEDVENAEEDVEADDVEENTEEDENAEEDVGITFEKLKYFTTLTKVQLLNLLLDNRIYEYKNKNIRKQTKGEMLDCAKECVKLIKNYPQKN
jgi:hypothetical protein